MKRFQIVIGLLLVICLPVSRSHGAWYDFIVYWWAWAADKGAAAGFESTLDNPMVKQYLEMYSPQPLPINQIVPINIDDYCVTRDLLNVGDDEKNYYMLTDDYTFYDLDGTIRTIPAGFIFDGASLTEDAMRYVDGSPIAPSLLVPGLIHDYMYRFQSEYQLSTKDTKAYADYMLQLNAYIFDNKTHGGIWAGVEFFGDDAYDWHTAHQNDYRRIFTSEYYQHNLEIYDKYGRTGRWTTGQLHNREGVSIDNEDCAECKIGGKNPNIVDNRKEESGSGGNGGAGSGGGGGGGTGDPGSGGGMPGENIDPGYGLPIVTPPLPDVTLPNGDGTRPWDDIVGFEFKYDRMLFLLSGDLPYDGSDFKNAFNALLNVKEQILNQTEQKSGELISDSQKIGQR